MEDKQKLNLRDNLYNELETTIVKTTLDNYNELNKPEASPSSIISNISANMYKCTGMNELYDTLIYMIDNMEVAKVEFLLNNYKNKLLSVLYQVYLKHDYARSDFDSLVDLINEWIDKNVTI